jgi:hypothetical protein
VNADCLQASGNTFSHSLKAESILHKWLHPPASGTESADLLFSGAELPPLTSDAQKLTSTSTPPPESPGPSQKPKAGNLTNAATNAATSTPQPEAFDAPTMTAGGTDEPDSAADADDTNPAGRKTGRPPTSSGRRGLRGADASTPTGSKTGRPPTSSGRRGLRGADADDTTPAGSKTVRTPTSRGRRARPLPVVLTSSPEATTETCPATASASGVKLPCSCCVFHVSMCRC